MPRGVFMEKRRRRSFTDEFKAKAVQLVRSSGKSVTAVATDLDLTVSSLRSWMMQAEVDAGGGRGVRFALVMQHRDLHRVAWRYGVATTG